MRRGTIALLFALGAGYACFAEQPQIIVSAAASLTDILTELAPRAEAYVGARVLFNFGGSGTLRRQVEEGAPVDVIFTAAAEDMDRLQAAGLVISASRRDALSNSMILIGDPRYAPAAGIDELRALLSKAEFLAIGNPDVVPAGRYAVEALTSYGLLSIVERKLVLGGTVREVLQYVQSGSAPLGIVFLTDALSVKPQSRLRQIYRFPQDAVKTPILYPVAVVTATKSRDIAGKMIDFLLSNAARDAFQRAGLILK